MTLKKKKKHELEPIQGCHSVASQLALLSRIMGDGAPESKREAAFHLQTKGQNQALCDQGSYNDHTSQHSLSFCSVPGAGISPLTLSATS